MEKSKEYEQLAAEEDNDLKAMGHLNKALREKRSERFDAEWLAKFGEHYDITHSISKGCYTLTVEKHGTIDYYPKVNKILIRAKNKWIKPGLRWMIKNLLDDTR